MQTNIITRTLTTLAISAITTAAIAQNCPSVTIAPANQINASTTSGYTFSGTGKKIGIINNGSGILTVSGNFNFQANDTLYIGANVEFSSYISGFTTGCMIINCGTANLGSANFSGGRADNYNVMTATYLSATNFTLNNNATFTLNGSSTLNGTTINNNGTYTQGYLGFSGAASTITNAANATMNFTAGAAVAVSGTQLKNDGTLNMTGYMSNANGTSVINTNRFKTTGDYAMNGSLTNKGMMIIGGALNVSSNATFFNACKVLAQQFSNGTANAENYGILQLFSNVWGSFNNSGTLKNAGYIRTPQFINNGTINNNGNNSNTSNLFRNGYIRIDGGSASNESANSGAINGGYVADIYNQYNMDNAGSNNTATVTNIPAYDTNNYQTATIIVCNCDNMNSSAGSQHNNATTLPVRLVSFNGKAKNESNELSWTIADVKDVKSMELEYASNGADYETINYTNLANTDQAQKSYDYTHTATAPVNYYRLKFTDLDGTVKYSNVVRLQSVGQPAATAAVSYYPNPFAGNISISLANATAGVVRVQMMDLSGRVVKTAAFEAAAGSNSFAVNDLDQLVPGIYILQVQAGTEQFQYKVVKQ
jgi:hypothetical protein